MVDWDDWPLTRAAIGEQDDSDEDFELGHSVIRALAEGDDSITEVAPGRWYVKKDQPGTWI